jgi:hypothetical protein
VTQWFLERNAAEEKPAAPAPEEKKPDPPSTPTGKKR